MRLFQLYGLPGSGKSTLAKKMCQENGHLVRVNKDLLREMLICNVWAPKKEKVIQQTAKDLVRMLLTHGHDVIVDETSLNPIHEQAYQQIAKETGAKYEMIKMDTSIEECIRRDKSRGQRGERFVGRDVILNMAHQWNIWRSTRTSVVFDMDGTLADCNHRRHFVRNLTNDPNWKKDWPGFFGHISEDTPRQEVLSEYKKAVLEGHDIIIVSARPDTYRKQTESWLEANDIHPDRLIMRQATDSQSDTIVKQEIIDKYLDKAKIIRWYDDRKCVIDQVRSNGINVINVGGEDNDF